ncbi:MAG: thioredoxin-disulfide reductase [Chloroflexi bacterium]|nr:thioredoxin-disulfide reductase [Chloroflexota bacterium]
MEKTYDLVIIGGGAAGLTAGLYASRARLKTVLLDKGMIGGQIALTDRVENYPAFPEGATGVELGMKMHEQATKFGMETEFVEVEGLELDGKYRRVKTSDGDFICKAVIVASGSEHRRLGVPGEDEFAGKGVSYCAVCDGAFFNNQIVGVVGGGDSALDEGLFLTKFVTKAFVIHRRDQLRASKILQERAFANPKMEFVWDTVLESIVGDGEVKALNLRNVKTNERRILDVGGVFIYVGIHPNTDFLKGLLPLDNGGHIQVNLQMETEVAGIFAAGDVRQHSARQLVSAAGDGATAALSAEGYISETTWD